ncbi:hypothetical protein, partial [Leptolyngbya sp. FACHB-711]|uniref:hypothetical protein n=1 Tax=Leptolyngbya sp. FACHB-711 TaxID=2692813 RepID=UPI00168998E3
LFFLDEHRQGWDESHIAAQIIEFLHDLDKSQSWSTVADRFKERAQWIWQQWYEETHPGQGGTHPVVDLIQDDRYLNRVVPLN